MTTLDAAARTEIAEVLVRYATGIDTRDWAAFRTCFTDDCEADYGPIGTWHGVDEITAWMTQAHADCGHTLHRITNIAVDQTGDGVVRARCYVDALVLDRENRRGVQAAGYYEDVLTHTRDGWRISRRRFTSVLFQEVGAPPTA